MKAIITRNPRKRRSILGLSLSVCFVVNSLCSLTVVPPAQAATVNLEPLADNWISSCSTGCTVNNGSMNELRVRTSWWGDPGEPKNFRPLLEFELASLPSDENLITEASLHLYYWNRPHSDPAGRTYNVHRLTNSWDETNSTWQCRDNYNNPPNEVYWDSYLDGVPVYQPGGGDFASTVYASAVVPVNINQWMTWDVTDLVKEWVGGTHENVGLLLKDATEYEADPGFEISYLARFRSKEYADGALHPYLEITYEVPPIPTVSGWGMVGMTLLLLTGVTVVYMRRGVGTATE